MKHLLLLAALAAAVPAWAAQAQAPRAAVMSDAGQAELTRVQAYLNGLRTLKARFVQVAQDGKTATGTAWLERPGRMRFEYDKPSPLLLVAGHGTVVFRDNQADQTSTEPLSQTPLGLLLGDTVVLTGPVTVTDFQQLPNEVLVTLVRTATPGDGSLTLVLNANPLALTGWSVVDAQGRQTRLTLTNITQGGAFDEKLFTFNDPDATNGGGNTP
jgi:outer membrane lipoprotein-sorting protein